MRAIGLIFSTVIVTMLMRYITISSINNVDEYKMMKSERFVLRYNKIYGAVGIISIVFAGIFAILPFSGIAIIDTKADIISAIGLVLLFLILGVIIVISVRNIKVEVSNDKIKYWNLFNRTKEIPWDEIKKVECSRNGLELKLVTDKNSIKIHGHMIGFTAFEVKMGIKLDKSMYLEAIKKIRAI